MSEKKILRVTVAWLLGLAALLALILSTEVQAQQNLKCKPRPEALQTLGQQYGEAPTGMGLSDKNPLDGKQGVVELYLSDKGTFTITLTLPNGMMCLVISGENWEDVEWIAPGLPVQKSF